MQGCRFCPGCASEVIELVYPEEGVGGRHTHTYECAACQLVWHYRAAGEPDHRLRSKYTIMKDGLPVEAPSFVLVLTDPAARVAATAYCCATSNQQLARDLEGLLAKIERHPEEFPAPGNEGRINIGASCRVWNAKTSEPVVPSTGESVLIIRRRPA
jgi:hypothetical protein